jgi:hypothetical protein
VLRDVAWSQRWRGLRLIEDPRIEAVVRAGKMSLTVGQEAARVADPEQRAKIIDRAQRGERVRVQDVKAVREPGQTKPQPAAPPNVETSTPLSVGVVMNNSSGTREEAVGPLDAPAALSSGRGHVLYSAFQDWRLRTYDELPRVTAVEVETLARVLRGDIGQLLERLDDAARRATD